MIFYFSMTANTVFNLSVRMSDMMSADKVYDRLTESEDRAEKEVQAVKTSKELEVQDARKKKTKKKTQNSSPKGFLRGKHSWYRQNQDLKESEPLLRQSMGNGKQTGASNGHLAGGHGASFGSGGKEEGKTAKKQLSSGSLKCKHCKSLHLNF